MFQQDQIFVCFGGEGRGGPPDPTKSKAHDDDALKFLHSFESTT